MGGSQGFGFDSKILHFLSLEISKLIAVGHSVGLVLGGGNLVRGSGFAELSDDRVVGDHMGMLATIMNALAVQSSLERHGVYTRVMSAISVDQICEPYIRRRAVRHLEKKRVCIFAAGTGNPYFTTDTAATLRATEMECQAIFKGTQVEGIYDKDTKLHSDAIRYDTVSYDLILQKNLRVMDASAIALARDNKMPIVVFSLKKVGGMKEVIQGHGRFTLVEPSLN